jgi:hypothetical protein
MLEGYFDDSGTHNDSNVVVWGGLIGPAEEFEKLDQKWRAQLLAPIPNKPPLEKFSLAHCVNAWGEFERYTPAERDLTRRNFRDLIIGVDIAPIAYIVMVEDYYAATRPLDRKYLGEAQNFAFSGCLNYLAKLIQTSGERVSCHFDQGQLGAGREAVLAAQQFHSPEIFRNLSIRFSPVVALTALQAADTIAYEAYQYGCHLVDPDAYPINPHFKDLTTRHGALFFSLHKEEIEAFLIPWRQVMSQIIGRQGK